MSKSLYFLITILIISGLSACQTVKVDPFKGEKIGVVLMHGKNGTLSTNGRLAGTLRSAGILVETPNMPWSRTRIYDKGYEESMDEIDTYVAKLKAAGAKKIVVGGHSIGGNAALGYAARRNDIQGAFFLAYGHVPGIPGYQLKLSDSTEKARQMIKDGKGEVLANFHDEAGSTFSGTVSATANDLFSWFDPEGPARINGNAPQVSGSIPLLCIDGEYDRWKRCDLIMNISHKNIKNVKTAVKANHMGTPDASIQVVADWLRSL
jgi:pimeloyl-ACP methyl ester carboxylesterase